MSAFRSPNGATEPYAKLAGACVEIVVSGSVYATVVGGQGTPFGVKIGTLKAPRPLIKP